MFFGRMNPCKWVVWKVNEWWFLQRLLGVGGWGWGVVGWWGIRSPVGMLAAPFRPLYKSIILLYNICIEDFVTNVWQTIHTKYYDLILWKIKNISKCRLLQLWLVLEGLSTILDSITQPVCNKNIYFQYISSDCCASLMHVYIQYPVLHKMQINP